MPLEDRIECLLCGRYFRFLGCHLLRRHSISADQYKKRFGVAKVTCPEVRYRIGQAAIRRGWGKRAWTDERILRKIRKRVAQGVSLARTRLARLEPALVQAATKHFGSWRAAVQAVGQDYDRVRLHVSDRIWTRAGICQAILARHAQGLPLNYQAVSDQDVRICSAALYHFGSWAKAVDAAGLDYRGVRAKESAKRWTVVVVLREIRRLARAGLNLAPKSVRRQHDRLYGAAYRLLGGWQAALLRCGINPAAQCSKPEWSRERVIEAILAEREAGRSLQPAAVRRRYPSLDGAVSRYFPGGWRVALAAARLDPDTILATRQWSRERVLAALQERQDAGRSLVYVHARRDNLALVNAAERILGTWAKAVRALGLSYREVQVAGGVRRWSRDSILAALAGDLSAGLSVRRKDVEARYPGLYKACFYYFRGGWRRVLERAAKRARR
ncbi:MAG: hypothetical protein HY718_16285 [Planctomycetes bacterium]|nr:hypothetical protein [Planctomycetota bacterium]